ncbi:hypothetical protein ACFV9C_44340 [Kribbella sp. NPDC059898]|uniref:hypothetical protein n=1 Tax=Kribbella sp. NPDC059898 TaxID=3346995 RepID=UPI00364AB36B
MEILLACALAYLFVSPDRFSLALSRGIFGAARGAATGKNPKTRKKSPRERAIVDGWREGIAVARARREAGRDLWSRGSRGAGRVAGGTASLFHGVQGLVAARRARSSEQGSNAVDDTTPSTDSPDAGPSRRGWTIPSPVRRPRSTPTSDAAGLVVDQDGNDVTPKTGKGPQAVADEPKTGPATPEQTPEAPNADLAPKTPETAPQPAPEAPSSAPDTTPSNTSRIGVIRMPNPNVELNNLADLDQYLKALENVFKDLGEAAERVKKSGKHLSSQWEGTKWGTRDLDRAVNDITEAIATFKVPATEPFAAGRRAIAAARAVGESIDNVKARGETTAFTAS